MGMFCTIKIGKRFWLWVGAILLALLAIFWLPGTGAVFPVLSSSVDQEKVVYLTFDDGPSVNTIEILNVLKEEKAPATFFVTGAETERGLGLYQRMLDEGHAIGLHSYSHRYREIYASADAYWNDLMRLADHIEEHTGYRPDIFRFPGGSHTTTADAAVLEEVKKRATSSGLCWFDWNALGKDDHSTPTSAQQIFENIVASAGDKDRIVTLMHDDGVRTTAADAVRLIIDHYKSLGYRFEKLTSETEPVQFS